MYVHLKLNYIPNIVGMYSLELYFRMFASKYHVSLTISVQSFTEDKEKCPESIAFLQLFQISNKRMTSHGYSVRQNEKHWKV